MLQEVTNIKINSQNFRLLVDVNDDPQKKGLQVQFIPQEGVILSPEEQDSIAIELQKRLDSSLSQYGMQVERDRQLKDQTIVAFFIYIEYFDELIKRALQGAGNAGLPSQTQEPSSERSDTEEEEI